MTEQIAHGESGFGAGDVRPRTEGGGNAVTRDNSMIFSKVGSCMGKVMGRFRRIE